MKMSSTVLVALVAAALGAYSYSLLAPAKVEPAEHSEHKKPNDRVEQDEHGVATYVEQHRTLGDRIRELVGAGFRLLDLVEPEWPAGHEGIWGQWSPLRGRLFPGTAIFVAEKPTG